MLISRFCVCFCFCLFVFFVCVFAFESLIIVLVWISLSSSYLEFFEFFVCLYLSISSNLGSFQPLFLQIFCLLFSLFSFWDSSLPCECWLSRLCFTGPLGFVHSSIFLSFCSSDPIISISSSLLILSSAFSNLLLNPSNEFLLSVLVLFKLSILFLVSF